MILKKELEQQRYEEKTKNADLVKKLNELATQNSQIQQRLMNSNRKNIELSLTRTSNFNGEGVCQNCSKSNYNSSTKDENKLTYQKNNQHIKDTSQKKQKWINEKQNALICEQTLHCDYIGVLFPTRNNVTVNDVCSQVKRNWQDLIFDYEGRYAFYQYQVRNKQFAQYLQMWDYVNNNIEKVIDHHLKIYDYAQKTSNSLKKQEGIIDNILQKLNEKQVQTFQLNAQPNSGQSQQLNLGTFTLEEILNLEKIIYSQLQTIIKEKFRRQLISNMNLSSDLILISQNNEKNQKLQNQGSLLNESENLIFYDFSQRLNILNQNDQINQNYKTTILQEDNQNAQKNTIFDYIKIQLKQIQSQNNINYNQQLQNTVDQENSYLRQLFYLNIDPKSLGEVQIDLNEVDFKHLKSIITKSTYQHLNIFNQQNEFENEFNKKTSYHTPKINKYIDKGDIYKKNSQSFEDDFYNVNKNKSFQQQDYLNSSNKQNILQSNSNNSAIEDKLQYHQNPIPKEQEVEIQSNFEKLQSQGCFFDGYSTISNLNSNYIPSNTSLQQNVMGSQRMNNLSNQVGNNNTFIQSNEQSISNNSNSKLNNFISAPLTMNNNIQYPLLQNYSSSPFQSNTLQNLKQQQPLVNQGNAAGNYYHVQQNLPQINNENDISKNQQSNLKMNINLISDSNQRLNNADIFESIKKNIGSENNINIESHIPNSQILLNKLNQTKSHSLHEQSSNNQIKVNNIQKQSNISNGMYYLGSTAQQQQNKIEPLINQTCNNSIENNSLTQKPIPKSLIYNINQYENINFSQKDSSNHSAHEKNFEKQDLKRVSDIQTLGKQLTQQEKAIQNKPDLYSQQIFDPNHKRNFSSQNVPSCANSVVINLNQNYFQNSKEIPNFTNVSKNIKNNTAEQLIKDESSDSLQHYRSGSVEQTKSYQKIIGNISKGGQNPIDYNNMKEISKNKRNNVSNVQYNSSKSQLNTSNSRQNIQSNSLSTRQNCQSANITPQKQQIKLNNMISVDIIQLQSNKSTSSKPQVQNIKQIQSNEEQYQQQQKIPLKNVENKVSSYGQQQNQVFQSQNDNILKQQSLSHQSSLNSSYNTSNNSNQICNKSTYSGFSHLNGTKNYIKFDENHIQQILQKSIQQKSNM